MKIAVVGSGSWGTALAMCLCRNGHEVTLWSHSEQKAKLLSDTGENPSLAGVKLPAEMKFSADPACVKNCRMVVIASPSFAVRGVSGTIAPYLDKNAVVVSVAKGIEPSTLMRMSEIVEEVTGIETVALTGPSHAEEVARDIPTACVAACADKEKAELVQNAFVSDTFRLYTTPDTVGAELGGAVKNVIALCAGVIDGMGFGDNTKAMLMTRGLTEMARLGVAMGAKKETFAGLAGIGDLIVTCTSNHSRNYRAGVLIGKGLAPEEAMAEIGGVVEGYYAAKSIHDLAQSLSTEMPIINAAYSVLYGGISTVQVISTLMQRKPGAESEDAVWQ